MLVAGTLAIALKAAFKPSKDDRELWLRMRSWWLMAGLFILDFVLGHAAIVALFGLISLLALKEYFSVVGVRPVDKPLLVITYLAIPLQYYWAWHVNYSLFITFIPIGLFLLLPFCMILMGETKSFLLAAASLQWGLLATVFALSHAAYLLALPNSNNSAGHAGLLLFLLFLTQFNDVLQYVWGKLLGKTAVVPHISPSKTLAGLVGGVATTVLLA